MHLVEAATGFLASAVQHLPTSEPPALGNVTDLAALPVANIAGHPNGRVLTLPRS